MTSGISPLLETTRGNSAEQTPKPADTNMQATGQDVFLKLLVSQIKNQDPLNPMDGMSFVTQLAQFSQLDALLGIRKDLEGVLAQSAAASPYPASPEVSQPAS